MSIIVFTNRFTHFAISVTKVLVVKPMSMSMLSSHVNFNGNYSVHRSPQSCINQSEQPMSMLKQVNVNVIKSMFPIFSQIVSIMYQSMKPKFKLSSQCQCFQVMSIIMFTNRFNHVSISEIKVQAFKSMSMFSSHVNCSLIFSQIVSIMYQSMKSKFKLSSQCRCYQINVMSCEIPIAYAIFNGE